MRRLRYALCSVVFAGVLGLLSPTLAWACSPLCPIYDFWHPLYWFHSCWDCPPNPPEG